MTDEKINIIKSNKFRLLYILTYAPVGIICPLIGQYLDYIGFSGTQIGIVTAVGTTASIPAGLIWGKIYAECNHGKRVVAMLCIMAATFALISLSISTFILFTIVYAFIFFFQGPVMGLCDAMVMEEKLEFSTIRLFGSVGYALAVFAGGRIGESLGLKYIFVLYAAIFFLAGIIALSIHEIQHKGFERKKLEGKYPRLLKEKRYIKMLVSGFFIIGANVANNTYFGFLYRDGGGTIAGIGFVFFLMTLSEAPFMRIAPRLAKKVTPEKLILYAMIISIARYFWFSTGPSSELLTAFFFVQGIVNGFILVEFIKCLSKHVKEDLVGIAMPTFYSVTTGSTIICNYFGGIMLDQYGSMGVYAFFTVYSLLGLLSYLTFKLYK
ncbi:MAG TPA: MFS transporter [Anaerovoracaceae bacterium]|nr:MFS transporter [Anaerovoracaceae bacterium]